MPNSEFVKANLRRAGQQIETQFQVSVVEPDTEDWRGEFFTSVEVDRGEYELVAEDGRTGTILVEHVYPSEDGSCRCEFKGLDNFGRNA